MGESKGTQEILQLLECCQMNLAFLHLIKEDLISNHYIPGSEHKWKVSKFGNSQLRKNILDLVNQLPVNKESYFNLPDQYWCPELLVCYSKWLLEVPDSQIPEVNKI